MLGRGAQWGNIISFSKAILSQQNVTTVHLRRSENNCSFGHKIYKIVDKIVATEYESFADEVETNKTFRGCNRLD